MSGDMVTVMCKLPNGLHLDRDGLRKVGDKDQVAYVPGDRVTLNGANSSGVIGGFGMTQVSADFWDAWLADHLDFPLVKEGIVFATPKAKDAAAEAQVMEGVRTGFEPIVPDAVAGVAPLVQD